MQPTNCSQNISKEISSSSKRHQQSQTARTRPRSETCKTLGQKERNSPKLICNLNDVPEESVRDRSRAFLALHHSIPPHCLCCSRHPVSRPHPKATRPTRHTERQILQKVLQPRPREDRWPREPENVNHSRKGQLRNTLVMTTMGTTTTTAPTTVTSSFIWSDPKNAT